MEEENKEKKEIVFYYSSTPSIFIYKIARLLKKNGYKTSIFAMCEKERVDYIFFGDAFDRVICSNFRFQKPNLKNLIYTIKRIPSLIKFLALMKFSKPYIAIGVAGTNWQIKLVQNHFFKKHPFIYFPYDIRSHFYKSKEEALNRGAKNFEIESEKYCFEHCDGFMHKGGPDEIKPLNGRIFEKINFPLLQLNFQPYCSKEYMVPLNKDKLSKKDGGIHVVYTGFIADNPDSKIIFLGYFKSLLKQKIHLHIYTMVPHVSKEEEKEYVKRLFSSLSGDKYLHLHEPLDGKNLIKEISKYDYALWLAFETNLDNIDQIYGVGNKVATYMEAGLPILYDKKSVYLGKLLGSYGMGIEFNSKSLNTIKKTLKKINYNVIEKNVEKARSDYNFDNNFPRLKKFIEQVVEKKNKLE